MKKLMLAVILSVFGIIPLFADVTTTPTVPPPSVDVPTLVTSLIDHVHAQVIITTAGKTRMELTDSFIQFLPYHGGYLIEGQAGWSGDTIPQPGEPVFGRFVTSAYVNVAPLIKGTGLVNIPANYSMLSALEFGPMIGYDYAEHHGYFGIQANLAFSLSPVTTGQ